MTYTPTDWADGTTPVNAANLDKMETGIDEAHDRLDALETETDIPQPVVNGQWLKGTGGAVVWSPIAQADVTGLPAALTARELTANKGVASGYAGLGSDGKVPAAQLPAIPAGYTLPARLGDYAVMVTDWNTARTNGWYMASNGANGPPVGGWLLCLVYAHNDIWVTQKGWDFTTTQGSTIWERRFLNSSWTAWACGQGPAWTGAWSASMTYGPGAIVSYNGRYWMSAYTHSNSAPA